MIICTNIKNRGKNLKKNLHKNLKKVLHLERIQKKKRGNLRKNQLITMEKG